MLIGIRGLFKKYADCLNCAARVSFSRCHWVRTDQLIKTSFYGRKYLHLLISYTVLSKECCFRLSDFKMDSLKEQRIAVKCHKEQGQVSRWDGGEK